MQKRYAGSVVAETMAQPCMANVASDVLETVLVNLIENSLQHGAKQIHIGISTLNNHTAIDVKDNGVGISEGNRTRLFTPFFTTKRENGGTGLGLVISRSLLRAFDADIKCIPIEKGAHFRILISSLIHRMTEAASTP
jgi:signal transduction histidine kinase